MEQSNQTQAATAQPAVTTDVAADALYADILTFSLADRKKIIARLGRLNREAIEGQIQEEKAAHEASVQRLNDLID